MTRRAMAWAIGLLGCLLAPTAALAGGDHDGNVRGVACPETARRNTTISAAVSFQNFDPVVTNDIAVTRGALALHLGNVNLVGPLAFSVPAGTMIPHASFGAPPCPGCPAPLIAGTASLTVPVRIPPQARPGTFVSVGLGFFGTKGADPLRKELGGEACVIEIVP